MGSKKLVEEFDSRIASIQVCDQESSDGENVSEPEIPFIPGFKLTGDFLKEFLTKNNLDDFFEELGNDTDVEDFANLNRIGESFRAQMKNSDMPNELEKQILDDYKDLQKTVERENFKLKISIEGRNDQEISYLAEDPKELIESIKNCYRDFFDNLLVEKILNEEKEIEAYLSPINITWKPLEPNLAGEASSSIEGTQNGNTIHIETAQEEKTAEFYVFKENLRIIKESKDEKDQSVFRENQVKKLAKYIYRLEKQYETPVEVSWISNKESKELYITEVREERPKEPLKLVKFQEKTETLLTGDIENQGVANGQVVKPDSPKEVDKVSENNIVVTDKITENWKPLISKAKAIVTNRQISSLSASFSRNTPIITNTKTATSDLENGEEITVDGYNGEVLKGNPNREIKEINDKKEFDSEEEIYLNLTDIDKGLKASNLSFDGAHIEPDLAAEEIEDIGVLASSFYPRKVFVHLNPEKKLEEQKSILNKVEGFVESGLDNIALVVYSQPSLDENIELKKDLRLNHSLEDLEVFLGVDRPVATSYIGELDDYFYGYVLNFRRYSKNIFAIKEDNIDSFLEGNREFIEEKMIEDVKNSEKNIILYSEGDIASKKVLERFDGFSADITNYNELRSYLENSKEGTNGEVLSLDAPVRIGDAAEEVVKVLNKKDSLSVEELLDRLDSDRDQGLVNQALGWLAKEDSIEILTKDDEILYRKMD